MEYRTYLACGKLARENIGLPLKETAQSKVTVHVEDLETSDIMTGRDMFGAEDELLSVKSRHLLTRAAEASKLC
jgi:hypothetical protein